MLSAAAPLLFRCSDPQGSSEEARAFAVASSRSWACSSISSSPSSSVIVEQDGRLLWPAAAVGVEVVAVRWWVGRGGGEGEGAEPSSCWRPGEEILRLFELVAAAVAAAAVAALAVAEGWLEGLTLGCFLFLSSVERGM